MWSPGGEYFCIWLLLGASAQGGHGATEGPTVFSLSNTQGPENWDAQLCSSRSPSILWVPLVRVGNGAILTVSQHGLAPKSICT